MPSLERPTVRLQYTVTGRGPRTVVLLHGWCDERHTWDPLMERLTPDFRCVALDLRGHGESNCPFDNDFSLAALRNDVAALLAAESVDRAVVVAHGYGAFIGLSLAVAAPASVCGLVVIEQPLDLPAIAEELEAGREFMKEYRDTFKALAK